MRCRPWTSIFSPRRTGRMALMQRVEHWIDGAATAGVSTRTAPIYDPARGVPGAEVLLAEPADVATAVDAASKAQVAWAARSALVRARVMFAMRDLLVAHTDELAALISAEHGKVLSDAR